MTMTWDQLELFPDVTLTPTIAITRGESFIYQCNYCGTLICIPSATREHRTRTKTRKGLAPCPHCCRNQGWTDMPLDVGPYRTRYPSVTNPSEEP